MLNQYKDGGLKLLDIQSFNCALKAKWVQKYLDDNNSAKRNFFFIFLFFFLETWRQITSDR